jgi:hypothetical protein
VQSAIGLAKRGTLVIDKSGTIRKVYPDADVALHAQEVLALIKPLPKPQDASRRGSSAGGLTPGRRDTDCLLCFKNPAYLYVRYGIVRYGIISALHNPPSQGCDLFIQQSYAGI